MKGLLAGTLSAAFLSISCASAGPALAPAEVSETEAAIRSAENAGAAATASDLLGRSKSALASARQAALKGNSDEAQQQIAEANAFAAAAEARARAQAVLSQAGDMRRRADELESKTKQLQERARP